MHFGNFSTIVNHIAAHMISSHFFRYHEDVIAASPKYQKIRKAAIIEEKEVKKEEKEIINNNFYIIKCVRVFCTVRR